MMVHVPGVRSPGGLRSAYTASKAIAKYTNFANKQADKSSATANGGGGGAGAGAGALDGGDIRANGVQHVSFAPPELVQANNNNSIAMDRGRGGGGGHGMSLFSYGRYTSANSEGSTAVVQDDAWAKRTAFLASRMAGSQTNNQPQQDAGSTQMGGRVSARGGGDGAGARADQSPTRMIFDIDDSDAAPQPRSEMDKAMDIDDSHVLSQTEDEDTYSDVYARIAMASASTSGTTAVV